MKKIVEFDVSRRNSKDFTHICGDCFSDNEIKMKINEIVDVLNNLRKNESKKLDNYEKFT